MAAAAASRRVIGNCFSRKVGSTAIGSSRRCCATSSSSAGAAAAAAESSPKIPNLPKRV